MRKIVESGEVPGIIIYSGQEPVAWCSIAPRENFASLNRSHVLKKIDDKPVWSIVCFYIPKQHRRQGMAEEAVKCAIQYAKSQKAGIIEAYPTVLKSKQMAPVSVYMGIPSVFAKAGFVECGRPSKRKMVMRGFLK